ncbi:MAG TPA: hypothetical protein VJR70_08890 [Stellaceae bacterium]|nr:hypothetical protein [Stellaceae bacterium]
MAVTANEAVARELRSSWFCQVHDIADIDLQRRTWLDATNLNPHWSYIEFVESYPDGDQLQHAVAQGWLTGKEFKVLNNLRCVLTEYSPPSKDYYDNAAVLDDPAWHAVVEEARRARQQLLTTTTNPQERESLLGMA